MPRRMFPLADWIDSHRGCRHNLALSGMAGSIRPPRPTPRDLRAAEPGSLRAALAQLVGVAPARVFLTHGATEANAAALLYLARHAEGGRRRARVRRPEYPPLFDTASWAGFELTERRGRVGPAIVSQPRNPEGDLWEWQRLARWAEGASALVVDETFREFSGAPSLARRADPRLWLSGSFTKAFAGDDIRVGFLVVPEEETERYARFHGLVFDGLPTHSVAAALLTLRERARILREIDRVLARNRSAWKAAFPHRPVPVAPVGFDRELFVDGDRLADGCLDASVLVCPGSYFGDARGVRLCLTRTTFPDDLAAYLAVRAAARDRIGAVARRSSSERRTARPRRGARGRARAARA